MKRRFRVVADTPIGVDSVVVEAQGTGPVLVLERFQEAFAKEKELEPDEVELLTIEDMATSQLVWQAEVDTIPTAEEIRAKQEAGLADVERQLDAGLEWILIGAREVSREAAWAVMTGMRKAFELDASYDRVELAGDGTWVACLQIPIGRFEE